MDQPTSGPTIAGSRIVANSPEPFDLAAYGDLHLSDAKPPNGRHPPPNGTEPKPVGQDVHHFTTSAEPEYDWVVPDLLERGDRLILTGAEGSGKSTLQRQLALQAASGVHPFTLAEIEPVRTLLVDLENGRRHLRRQLTRLLTYHEVPDAMAWVASRPDGLHLAGLNDQGWLEQLLQEVMPDVLLIGPLYKMNDGDPTEEKVAKPCAEFLDHLRAAYGVTLVLEAHTPHAATPGGKRPQRPYGASLWLRWPEFGLHLDGKSGLLEHWRGPRDEREWPAVLTRGAQGEWPWLASTKGGSFAVILQAQADADHVLTEREVVEITGMSKSSVHRAIEANRTQWDQTVFTFGQF